ncbi:MAG: hypothetical protein FWE84_05435, partial [Firmicutes bacterium]|nr:hypothetical protein [Bacillota bacterium]
IITIINQGCSKQVMDAARAAGATGGTVMNGLGTGSQMEKLMGLNLGNEKEIVMIVAELNKTAEIIAAIKRDAGAGSKAQGITFSLPVGDFTMLSNMLDGGGK